MRKPFFTLIIFLAIIQFLLGINVVSGQNILKWKVYDIILRGPDSNNPFDIRFGANICAPDGRNFNVSGFYNGNREYVVRFAPDRIGKWTYETWSSSKNLAGRKGEITCVDNGNSTLKGPLQIPDSDPEHFYYSDGTPYFLMAFECDWLFALDLDNPVDMPKTRILVDQIAENGLNHVVMNVYAHDVVWEKDPDLKKEYDYGNPPLYPFGGSNDLPDFSTLNTVFFQRLERVIEYLNDKNIIAHLMIYVWNKKVNWPEMYSKGDNMYFDYVIARYQAYPNIVWDISKEALQHGRCDMDYVIERIKRMRKLDVHERLMTVHDYGFCNDYPELVDFISVQLWRTDLYSNMREIKNKYQGKPVFNIEHGGYEYGPYEVLHGDYNNPEICLDRNYQCAFAGVYSTYYWQNTSWNVIIHDPASMNIDERPKFHYYKNLTELFSRYPFEKLRPANESSSGLCLKDDTGLYLLYIPGENYAIHTLFDIPDSFRVKEIWFNPFTNEYIQMDTGNFHRWKEYRSPWQGIPSVLIIEAEQQ